MAHAPVTVDGKKPFHFKNYSPRSRGGFKTKKEARAALKEGMRGIGVEQERLFAQHDYGVVVILQGMDTAGKSTMVKALTRETDAHGCRVTSFKAPSRDELDHDYLWRCHRELPPRGCIGFFDRSYYEELLPVRVHPEFLQKQHLPQKLLSKHIWKQRFEDIRNFERYLIRNGFVVIKLFLHVSKKEQKKRLLKRIALPEKNWKYSQNDIDERRFWDEYQKAYQDLIKQTATPDAPWHIIPADVRPFGRALASQIVWHALRRLKLRIPTMDKNEHRRSIRRVRKALKEEDDRKH